MLTIRPQARPPMRRRAIPLVLAALALAGCLQSPGPSPALAASAARILPDLSDVAPPMVDAHRARLWWESFVNAYPERVSQSPTNVEAATQLANDLHAAGYQVRVFYYTPSYGPTPPGQPSPVPAGVRAIVGIKPGSTDPKHVVAWVAHYDSNQGTVYAAYDDGSGTAVAMELARVLAAYDNSKTLMPIFFDAEELGLVASQDFVQQAMASKEYTFDMVIGHDMTGINCPGHPWPMYQMVGENYADQLLPIEDALYSGFLKWDVGHADVNAPTDQIPPHCVVILNGHDRNSDERRFKEAGVPVLRMAGGRHPGEYPAYHQPNDTVEYVYRFVGGPDHYEQGLRTDVVASYWNAVAFDRLPPLEGGS
jgi:hypothetical protein